jgi:hypothetical protein
MGLTSRATLSCLKDRYEIVCKYTGFIEQELCTYGRASDCICIRRSQKDIARDQRHSLVQYRTPSPLEGKIDEWVRSDDML